MSFELYFHHLLSSFGDEVPASSCLSRMLDGTVDCESSKVEKYPSSDIEGTVGGGLGVY